ncbi:MAG: hypothetical protein SFY70_09435 [Bacteroidia bacterium]|nr:hypothetical protein [Bacteroidia bacterium]
MPTSPEVTTYRAVTAADTALMVIRPGVGALLVYCDSSAVWVASSNRVTGEGEFRVEWNGGADLATLGFLAAPCLVASNRHTHAPETWQPAGAGLP